MENNMLFPFNLTQEENSNKWNRDFFNSYKAGDKKQVMNMLKEANEVYLDEFYIYNSILAINSDNASSKSKTDALEALKKCQLVKGIVKDKNKTISINTENVPIKISKLSDILSDVKLDKHSKDELVRKSKYSAQYISQIVGFPNSVVSGYVYGIADKSKTPHTWVEFKNKKNEEFVIDYDSDTVYNKEGYYFIRHAEAIKKVSSDDIKGKSSVGKFISFDNVNTEPEIEFDIDFDER